MARSFVPACVAASMAMLMVSGSPLALPAQTTAPAAASAAPATLTLMPVPSSMTLHDGRLGIGVVVAHAPHEGRHSPEARILDGTEVCVEIEKIFAHRCDAYVVHEWSPPST